MTTNAVPVPSAAIVSPASAGPRIRAVLNVAALSDIALGSNGLPTSSETNDCRTGVSTAVTTPHSAAKT